MDHARLLRPLPTLAAALPVGPRPRIRLHGGLPSPGGLHPQLPQGDVLLTAGSLLESTAVPGQPDPRDQHHRGRGRAGRPLVPAHSATPATGAGQDMTS